MPGKSRRGRGRFSARSKKRRGTLTRVAQQQAADETHKLTAPAMSTPSPSAPTIKAMATGTRYPYVVAELRRIGILAVIMLVILVVLALVLP